MNQKAKKKRQQKAQTRLALARQRQQEREQRQQTLALRAEKRWSNAQHQLVELGATVKERHKQSNRESQYSGRLLRWKNATRNLKTVTPWEDNGVLSLKPLLPRFAHVMLAL